MAKRTLTITLLLALTAPTLSLAADWLQFRGPQSAGVAAEEKLPTQWDAERNLAWKTVLPGRGLSSPIVVGDNIVVTASSGARQERLHVVCFNGDSGEKRWERQFWATGLTFCHPKTCVAAPTPVSDGERIFAFYSSNDLICLDLQGNLLWLRGLTHDYPNSSNSVGMTSSPLIIGNTVIVQVENESNSFASGIDTATGSNRWKIPRPAKANWSSPVALTDPESGETIAVLQSPHYLTAHNPNTGEELWRYDAKCSSAPSTVVAANRLYVPSKGLTALELPTQSNEPAILWQRQRVKFTYPSPIVYGDSVYTLHKSILTCSDITQGEVRWKARLKGPFSGTPVIADGFLYAFNEDGLGQVVDLTREGRVIAENMLGERFLCTPAVAGGGLYVRSDGHLWKIAQE